MLIYTGIGYQGENQKGHNNKTISGAFQYPLNNKDLKKEQNMSHLCNNE